MLCGIHNHDLPPKLSGHLLAGRLKAEEKQRVIDMTKSLAKPRNILTDLKESYKESVTLIKQVYNARTRWRMGQDEVAILDYKVGEASICLFHKSKQRRNHS